MRFWDWLEARKKKHLQTKKSDTPKIDIEYVNETYDIKNMPPATPAGGPQTATNANFFFGASDEDPQVMPPPPPEPPTNNSNK